MKALVAALLLVASVIGGAGLTTLAFERRLAALAPEGVSIASLGFDPLTGRVDVRDLVARDAVGRVVFRAAALRARTDALSVLTGGLALRQVEIDAPIVRLQAGAGPVLATLAGMSRAGAVSLEGVMVNNGSVVLNRGSRHGEPLEIRDVNLRVSRLDAETADMAFVADLAVYGAIVRVTGQPVRTVGDGGVPLVAGYAVRARGRDVDVAAALRDFPLGDALAVERGSGDVDLTVLFLGGAPLVSGSVRVGTFVAHLDDPEIPRLAGAGASVTLERFDVQRLTGNIARLEVVRPRLDLHRPAGVGAALRRLAVRLDDSAVHVRRVQLTGATVRLPHLGLREVDLSAHAAGPEPGAPWSVTGRATIGRDGVVAVRGAVSGDLAAFDGLVRARNVPVGVWRRPLGLGDWDGVLAFEGRVRVVGGDEDTARAVAEGDARLTGLQSTVAGRFPRDVARLRIRRFDWPAAVGDYDATAEDRPFAVVAAGPARLGDDWAKAEPPAAGRSLGAVLGALAVSVRDATATSAVPVPMLPAAGTPPSSYR